MKEHSGFEVQLRSFLTLALDGGERSVAVADLYRFAVGESSPLFIEKSVRWAPEQVWAFW